MQMSVQIFCTATIWRTKEETCMLVCDYEVIMIDGDYAHLKRLDDENAEVKLTARALLPPEIREGSILHYEWMQYTIVE